MKSSKEEYKENFQQALEFLNGNYSGLELMLTEKMKEASEKLAFEEAAEYRDLINSVNAIAKKQKILPF